MLERVGNVLLRRHLARGERERKEENGPPDHFSRW
jgi:hypothetical protein